MNGPWSWALKAALTFQQASGKGHTQLAQTQQRGGAVCQAFPFLPWSSEEPSGVLS